MASAVGVLSKLSSGHSERTPAPAPFSLLRRQEYLHLAGVSSTRQASVAPKSRLIVLNIENTLVAPVGRSGTLHWVGRPYLRPFLKWVMSPQSSYALAIWSHATRAFALEHLRITAVDDILFRTADPQDPAFQPGMLAFLGYEDSGMSDARISRLEPAPPKDLQLLWNKIHAQQGCSTPVWDALNTVLVDFKPGNAAYQPNSLILAEKFTAETKMADDDFLLALLGALVDLAPETNFASAIKRLRWNQAGLPSDDLHLITLGERALEDTGIPAVYPGTDRHLALRLPYHSPQPRAAAPQATQPIPRAQSVVDSSPASPSSVTSFSDDDDVPESIAVVADASFFVQADD